MFDLLMSQDMNKSPSLLETEITSFETRLISAMRQEPNRLEMWLKLGNPMRNHKILLEMYMKILDIALRHELEFFVEYGSLVGAVRHRGMVPWDYDMDIAATCEGFKKWVEVGTWYEENDPEWGFKFYNDPDYSVDGYCLYWKKDPNVLCDINEYREVVGDDGVTYLECTVPDWNYPRYRKDFIFPLQRVMTLGYPSYIPRMGISVLEDVESILGQCTHGANGELFTDDYENRGLTTNQVKWFEYDPIPFILSKLYNPKHIEKLVTWPCIEIPEANSIIEGIETFGPYHMPFIVRKTTDLSFNYEEFKEKVTRDKTKSHAWTKSDMDLVPELLVSKSLEEWEKGKLSTSYLDSIIEDLVAPDTINASLAPFGIDHKKIMLILSNHDTYTKFHQDSPYGNGAGRSGGGWMYLGQGRKLWHMIPFDDSHHIFDSETKKFIDLPMHENLYLNDHALWGKIYQGYCEDGDFIYFPPGMTHRVTTYSQSIGFGGYVNLPSDGVLVEKIRDFYESHGLDGKDGILFNSNSVKSN